MEHALDPMTRVRVSTRYVAAHARLVQIDRRALDAFADRLPIEQPFQAYHWDRSYHLNGAHADLVDYVFTVTALNFGSGFSPLWKARRSGTTYTAVAGALKQLCESGTALDAFFAARTSPEQIAALLGVQADFPLVGMYARSLSELGGWVASRYGSYSALLASLPPDAAAAGLVEMLVQLPCFDDHAAFQGREVYFYKRAQILVNDLHLALGADISPFAPAQIASLTAFADNLVPHVLRKEGVLRYDPGLLEQISRREPLAPGSAGEVEIRAAGVVAVEELVARLKQGRGAPKDISAAMLDNYLWSIGQQQQYKAEPRHLTQTYFY